MSVVSKAKVLWRATRRRLRLTPMCRALREIESRGVVLSELDAVELFGRAGDFHTMDYASKVKSLEVWEIDEAYRKPLHENLPKARVKIVDTYAEVKRTGEKFGLVVCDNPTFIHGGHCENFDLFPDLYRIAADRAVFIIIVIPFIGPDEIAQFSNLADPDQQECRKTFYGCDDPTNIPLDLIARVYRGHAESEGYRVDWTTIVPRARTAIKYFIQHVTRVGRANASNSPGILARPAGGSHHLTPR